MPLGTRWAAVIAATALAGCGDDTGGSGGGTGSGGATATSGSTSSAASTAGSGGAAPACADGPALGGDAACLACQAESCCLNAAGCQGSDACSAVDACMEEGGSRSDCASANPDAVWFLSGLIVCRQNSCSGPCGEEPATCGNIIPSPASCTEDVQAACCAETATCGENDACVALIYQCFDENECNDQACLDACYAAFPDGVTDFEAMADCWGTVECL